jgi:dipeptidase D
LLNLDSEEEGQIYIGCAGGKNTSARFTYQPKPVPEGYFWFKVSVKGLRGGHSGSDIDKGLGNANKIVTRFLYAFLDEKYKMALAEISGGNLHNAIPREAYAIAGVKDKYKENVRVKLNTLLAEIQEEYQEVEPNLNMLLESVELPSTIIDSNTAEHLILALYACPHGVMRMSRAIPGLVETSTNLAAVKMLDNQGIEVVTSQRSSVESSKEDVANMVTSVFRLAGAEVTQGEGYPGWKPNPDSGILKQAVEVYKKLFNQEPEIKAIHAGLECGLFLKKYPYLDMISIGPTMSDVHSPNEKVHIPSVAKWWTFLVKLLENISA